MSTELETLIYQGITEASDLGESTIQVSQDCIGKALGKIRHLGYRANLGANGLITISFKKDKQKQGRPLSYKLSECLELLATNDPVIFPSNRPKADSQYFRYHDLFTRVKDGLLFVSKEPFDQEISRDREKAKGPKYSELTFLVKSEQTGVVIFDSAPEAKRILTQVTNDYGRSALIKLVKEGVAVKAIYTPKLPIELFADYPDETIIGWARELVNRIGTSGACINYNRHQKKFNKKVLSMKAFEHLMGLAEEES